MNRLTPPPAPGAAYHYDGDIPVRDLLPGEMSRGPLTLGACRDELDQVERELAGLRMLLRQSGRELHKQKQRQAAALRELERVEEHLQCHSREEIRSVYINASEAEMRMFMISEQLDQARAKLQAFERYEHFLRGAITSFAAGGTPAPAAAPTALLVPASYSGPASIQAMPEPQVTSRTCAAKVTALQGGTPEAPLTVEVAPAMRPGAVNQMMLAGNGEGGEDEETIWSRPTIPLAPVRYQEPSTDSRAAPDDRTGGPNGTLVRLPACIGASDEPTGWVVPSPVATLAPDEDWREARVSEVAKTDKRVTRIVRAGADAGKVQEMVAQPATGSESDAAAGLEGTYRAGPAGEPHQPEESIAAPARGAPVRKPHATRRRSVKVRPAPEQAAPAEETLQPHIPQHDMAPLPEPQMPVAHEASAAQGDPERGIVVMSPRTASLAFNDGLRGLTPAALNRIVQAQEEMAERVARQMQSGPIQSLMNLAMEASLYGQMAEVSPEAALEGLRHLHSLVNTIIQEHAQSLLALRPLGHGERGFIGAVRRYMLTLSGRHHVLFEFLAPHGERPLRAETAIPVFRIVQEALLNAALHSHASLVLVTVDFLPDRLTVAVEDDGVGFDAHSVLARAIRYKTGGIMGMLERTEMLGGWLRVESMPGRGCLVEFGAPLGAASSS